VVLAGALIFRQRTPVESQKEKPQPPPAVAIPNMIGTWQTVVSDGVRRRTCVTENAANGEYRFSASCPPPFANERGKGEMSADGTWRLRSYSGRTDQGTYRVISADQVEMTGQLGTAVWTRMQTPPDNRAAPNPAPPPQRRVRDQPRSAPAQVQDDWRQQEAERRALQEQRRRQQQEALERQRQAQFEQQQQRQFEQQQRQRQVQEQQTQRQQQDRMIQEGAKIIQDLFRR
jgi:hypothetical protein